MDRKAYKKLIYSWMYGKNDIYNYADYLSLTDLINILELFDSIDQFQIKTFIMNKWLFLGNFYGKLNSLEPVIKFYRSLDTCF